MATPLTKNRIPIIKNNTTIYSFSPYSPLQCGLHHGAAAGVPTVPPNCTVVSLGGNDVNFYMPPKLEQVTQRIYPYMGHTINEDELAQARVLIAGVIG